MKISELLEKCTPDWEEDGRCIRSQRGIIATIPTPQNGGVFDCAENLELIARAPALARSHERLRTALEQIFMDLPSNREWLDPAIERFAKTVVAEAEKVSNGE